MEGIQPVVQHAGLVFNPLRPYDACFVTAFMPVNPCTICSIRMPR
jgi:hypothetical protein